MSSRILQKLHENERIRNTFQELLIYLAVSATAPDGVPSVTEEEMEGKCLEFDDQLTALTNLVRAVSVKDDDTVIGHWCIRENESKVKGMSEWSVYWLDMWAKDSPGSEIDYHVQSQIKLTLWAVGKDDHTIEKAIKVWVETHIPTWEIEKLLCVRR